MYRRSEEELRTRVKLMEEEKDKLMQDQSTSLTPTTMARTEVALEILGEDSIQYKGPHHQSPRERTNMSITKIRREDAEDVREDTGLVPEVKEVKDVADHLNRKVSIIIIIAKSTWTVRYFKKFLVKSTFWGSQ